MGNGFGEKLRAERLERGLTQAELGRDLYSPSYISLLETGRREPTADVIEELARRLELAPKALEAWSQPISVSDAEYVLAGLYARQAWDLRDYALAAEHAANAARIAWRKGGASQRHRARRGAHDQAVGLTNICQLARTTARSGSRSPRSTTSSAATYGCSSSQIFCHLVSTTWTSYDVRSVPCSVCSLICLSRRRSHCSGQSGRDMKKPLVHEGQPRRWSVRRG